MHGQASQLHAASLYAVQAYDRVAPVVQDAANIASPFVKSAITTAGDVAAPALRAVEPSIKVLLLINVSSQAAT